MENLREQLRATLSAARATVDQAKAESRALSPEEITSVEAKRAKAAELRAQIEAFAAAEQMQAELDAMAPESQRTAPAPAAGVAFETREEPREKGQEIGTIVRAAIQFGRDKRGALAWAEQTFGGGSPEYRALGATEFTAGGALVPSNFVNSVIELLRAQSAVRRAGPVSVPLVNGTADIPKMTGGATGTWVGENQNITKSEPTFGQVKLVEKTLAVVVPVSNKLLQHAAPSVDRMIRDDLVASFANTEDDAFFVGAGTEYKPKGLYSWATSANKVNSGGTALADIRADFRKAINALKSANVRMLRPAVFMAPRSLLYLAWDIVDANSNYAFPEAQQNRIRNFPVYDTANISITTGSGTQSRVYVVDMADAVIGDGDSIMIEVFPGGAYHDGSSVVSGISQNQSVIRAIHTVDFAMRHTESVYVIEAVSWGA